MQALKDAGVLRQVTSDTGELVYALSTPFRLHITAGVASRLLARYDPDLEIGGVIAARPVSQTQPVELLATQVYSLRNTHETPESKYRPPVEELKAAYAKCLNGPHGHTRYFPIEFHSHPSNRQDMREEPYSFIREYFNLETSEADRRYGRGVWHHKNIAFTFPHALVSKRGDELFIGIHGGLVVPDDFREFMMKVVAGPLEDLLKGGVEWAEDSIWKTILVGLGAVGYIALIGLISAVPGGLQQFSTMLLDYRKEHGIATYFGFTKGEPLLIEVPAPDERPPLDSGQKPWAHSSAAVPRI